MRKRLGRWWPDGACGVGFSIPGTMCSGELELELDIEGRTGSVWLSKEMWIAIGERAGWVSREEAERVWNEAFDKENP